MWIRAVLVTTIGVVSLALLACIVALARDTTGHDWYAARKLTVAELLIRAGFDGSAPTEYRTWRGEVVTLTRGGLGNNGDAWVARDRLLRTARESAELGAWCGFGGALLCLALIRRPRDEPRIRRPACGPTAGHRAEARDRLTPAQEMPMSAPVPALTDRQPASEPPRATTPEAAVTRQGEPGTGKDNKAEPARRERRNRDYGRWV